MSPEALLGRLLRRQIDRQPQVGPGGTDVRVEVRLRGSHLVDRPAFGIHQHLAKTIAPVQLGFVGAL